jgi:hypothetical protein
VCNDRTGRSPKTKEDEVNISQTTSRIGAVLAAIGAIVVLASSAQAATSRPAGMSQPAYRALMIRSEALNTLHGNAVTRLSPQQFTGLYQAGANDGRGGADRLRQRLRLG